MNLRTIAAAVSLHWNYNVVLFARGQHISGHWCIIGLYHDSRPIYQRNGE